MGVTLSSRVSGFCDGGSLVKFGLDAVDLVEKSEAEGRKLRRASSLRRSLVDGGRVHLFVRTTLATIASTEAVCLHLGEQNRGLRPGASPACRTRSPHQWGRSRAGRPDSAVSYLIDYPAIR